MLRITSLLVEETIQVLKGSSKKEKVLLWLGKITQDGCQVQEIFEPIQRTASNYFEIPPEGMESLMAHIKQTRRFLVAQIHTHPGRAYHSAADDKWAIARHEGAYSLVLPYFAASTTIENFLSEVATFRLNKSNRWVEVNNSNLLIL
jgi:proteasome lid subunit RPN8/RPN11